MALTVTLYSKCASLTSVHVFKAVMKTKYTFDVTLHGLGLQTAYKEVL
jgi:hypothetical protein